MSRGVHDPDWAERGFDTRIVVDEEVDAIAAAIYSAESLLGADPTIAFHAAQRLVDWAFSIAEAEIEPLELSRSPVEQFIEESAHAAVQLELVRLLNGLSLLERGGTDPAVFERLRRSFADS